MSESKEPFITIVSGLPRSGTSLMMQMLQAGGLPALTDSVRAADDDNPRGYFEFERVKQIKHDKTWLADAVGRVVKMVHLLLYELPPDRQYRVIFMRRHLDEVIRSQSIMLARQGRTGAGLPSEQLAKVFEGQISKLDQWLSGQSNFRVRTVFYHELVADPPRHAAAIRDFLGLPLDLDAMAAAVDPKLYRNRR